MKKFLCFLILLGFASSALAANDLLILHCEGGAHLTGIENNIGADPYYDCVDYIDGSTALVPLATLQNYTCVFTWNNFQYISGQGDLLADYVDLGGKVVICGWAITQCYGRIIDDADYCPMIGGSNEFQYVNLGTTYAHDILDGVSTIIDIHNWVMASMESGAYLIAENSMGTPLAAINVGNSVVALNLVAGDYINWSGDGWILINNSIKYLMESVSLDATTWGNIKTSF